VREIHAPLSILAVETSPPVPELQEIGIARVSYGSSFARYAITAARDMAAKLLADGDIAPLMKGSMPRPDYLKLLSGPFVE
jgi:2-methylisocitrate lyase-like PEP mutase family enzyme